MAVATAEQVRLYVRAISGTAEDATIDTLIARFDAVAAGWCGFPAASSASSPTFEDVTITQYLDGPGGVELFSPVYPIQSVTTLHDSTDRTYASADLIDAGDYTVYGDEGLVRLDDDSAAGSFSTASRAIKLTAVIGFATMPAAIVHACALQTAFWYQGRDHIGRSSVSQGGGSISTKGLDLLPEVKQALSVYRMTAPWLG